MKRFAWLSLGALVTGLLLSPVAALAQGGGPGQRGGGFDAEEMRQRMADRMKEALGASDAEWNIIRPRLEDVQQKQMATMTGRMGGMLGMLAPGRAGRPGAQAGDAQRPQRRPGAAAQGGDEAEALRQALESESTPATEIRTRLSALREARAKAEAELKQSQDSLREVLTMRQEAQLVLMGMLP